MLLDLGEGEAGEFEAEDLAATFAELGEGELEAVDEVFVFEVVDDVDLGIGQGRRVDVDELMLAAAVDLAGPGGELEAGDLEGEWHEFVEGRDVGVFLMEHEKDLLGDVFGDLPPITRCRERENPFTQ